MIKSMSLISVSTNKSLRAQLNIVFIKDLLILE